MRITSLAPFSRIPSDFRKWPSLALAAAFAGEAHENELIRNVLTALPWDVIVPLH
jgi:hypothetical protein